MSVTAFIVEAHPFQSNIILRASCKSTLEQMKQETMNIANLGLYGFTPFKENRNKQSSTKYFIISGLITFYGIC